ncbi:MAG TPA: protease inhibitor I9 family protein, partial [Pilimelia sp.]|nr:protease inhibitor I9 family protein [Pilimelia sp.]
MNPVRRHRRIAAGLTAAAAALSVGMAATVAQAAAATPAGGTIRAEGAPGAIRDSYIVVFRGAAAEARRAASAAGELTRRYGGTVRWAYQSTVRGFAVRMPAAAARRLAAHPAVAYVEQDRTVSLRGSQANPPWGLDRIDQPALPLSKTYGYPTGAGNVTAYVLDTGIRVSHKDFGGRARHGRDFIDNDAVADDCNGHGTHVAGAAAEVLVA